MLVLQTMWNCGRNWQCSLHHWHWYLSSKSHNRLFNAVEFLKYVGSLYKFFSIHNKGDIYKLQKVKDAPNIVNNFESYLSTLTQSIRSKVDKKLSKHLNGPKGSIAGVTIKSVRLISSGLNRLNELTDDYSYRTEM